MAKKNESPKDGFNEILLYTTPDGNVKVEIYLQNETIWLTQQKIADLFGMNRTVVTKHLKNIYTENELHKEATCAKIAQVQQEGNREITRQIDFDKAIKKLEAKKMKIQYCFGLHLEFQENKN